MLYEQDVRQELGSEVVDCLLEAVDHGYLSLQQVEDLARGLHPTVGGNFLRLKQLPNFNFDRASLRKILSDWYQYDGTLLETGVTLEKLQRVLLGIGLRLEEEGEVNLVSVKTKERKKLYDLAETYKSKINREEVKEIKNKLAGTLYSKETGKHIYLERLLQRDKTRDRDRDSDRGKRLQRDKTKKRGRGRYCRFN